MWQVSVHPGSEQLTNDEQRMTQNPEPMTREGIS